MIKINKHYKFKQDTIDKIKEIQKIENDKRLENNLPKITETETIELIIRRYSNSKNSSQTLSSVKEKDREYFYGLVKKLFNDYGDLFLENVKKVLENQREMYEWIRIILATTNTLNDAKKNIKFKELLMENYVKDLERFEKLKEEMEVIFNENL